MPDDTKAPASTSAVGGIVAYAFGLALMAFGVTFYSKLIAVLLIAGSLGYALYQWELVAHWSSGKRAISVALLSVATIVGFAWPLWLAWREANKSPDDLRVTFDFIDRSEFGKSPIDFNITIFNSGSRPVQIQDIGALVYAVKDNSNNGDMHVTTCDEYNRFPPSQVGMLYDEPIQGAHNSSNHDYPAFHFRISAPPAQIPAGNIKVIPARIAGITLGNSGYNGVVVCPMVRYFDADGKQFASICPGYNVIYKTEVFRGIRDVATFYWPGTPIPHRLLPHDAYDDCPTGGDDAS